MINREKEIQKVYGCAENSVEVGTAYKLVSDLIARVRQLESICDELVNLPKGVEPQEWSDYKMNADERGI